MTDNPIGFGLLPEDDEGDEWFKMTLTNDKGDELSVEDTWSYLSDYIVSVEIIDFVADKEECAEITTNNKKLVLSLDIE